MNHLTVPFNLPELSFSLNINNELNNQLVKKMYPGLPQSDSWKHHQLFVQKRQKFVERIDKCATKRLKHIHSIAYRVHLRHTI